MSNSYSKVIEFETDHYDKTGYGPTREKYNGRIHYHHTSDTVAWQRTVAKCEDPSSTLGFQDRFSLFDDEWGALVEAIKSTDTEVKDLRAGVEAVLGVMEREFKRAREACKSFPWKPQMTAEETIMHEKVCAQSHQASRLLIAVRYAFKNAGLPVATVTGEPKLLK